MAKRSQSPDTNSRKRVKKAGSDTARVVLRTADHRYLVVTGKRGRKTDLNFPGGNMYAKDQYDLMQSFCQESLTNGHWIAYNLLMRSVITLD